MTLLQMPPDAQPPQGEPLEAAESVPDAAEEPRAEEQQAGQQPQFLTREEFVAALQAFSEQLGRRLQSQLDKRDRGLERRVREKVTGYLQAVKAAKSAGQIDDGQAKKLEEFYRQQALNEALYEEQNEVEDEAAYDAINANADFLYQQLGLTPGDPELAEVITDGTPEEFLASIVRAGQMKTARLLSQNSQGRLAARNPALSPNGRTAPRNPIASISDSETLWQLAAQDFQKQLRGAP